ncbi:phosphatase PAP2 family protein [Phytoactinopolyspora mesophila]|uniref:phosphatase PAP2 family protein n=1 Tax=Phytoactinopolyspora mesophila TaxID=2650750 RepID=UPI00139073BC
MLILTAALLYSLVRGLTDDRVDVAFENAERVMSFQDSLGFFIEPDLQDRIVGNDAAINVINAIYIGGYWPVLVGTLLWLLIRHPARYPLFRNALLASGAITLVIFALFPLAPPRFLPEHGFTDTVSQNSEAYRDFNASPLVNEYAAMPSLHFGWILLLAIAWIIVGRNTLARIAGVLMPTFMFIAIVLTGNHYILDGIVGGAVVLAGLAIAAAIEHRKEGREPTDHSDVPRDRIRDHNGDGSNDHEPAPIDQGAAGPQADRREKVTLKP